MSAGRVGAFLSRSLFPVAYQLLEAVAANRLIGVLGSQQYLFLVGCQPVGVVGEVAAADADGVYLGDAVAISAGIGPKGFPV